MSKNPRYPDFVIGGAPKCGTSSLYFWLAAHPQVYGSTVKETFFFADEVNRFNEGCNVLENPVEDYSRYFEKAGNDQLAFEATAHYLYYENAMKYLKKLPSRPKVIFLLREPSRQIFSHYKMEKYRTGTQQEDFVDYIRLPKISNYVNYEYHLSRWFDFYGRDRIKVMLFEHLKGKKEEAMQEVCAFLGIDGSFYQNFDFEHRNQSVVIKSKWFHFLGLKYQKYMPHALQKIMLPVYMKVNSKGTPEATPEERTIRKALKEKYRSNRAGLQKLLPELDFTLWN